MTESVGGIQHDKSLQDFCYVVKRFLMIGQELQANLLRYGKLHIPIVNTWWGVGRVNTLQIRPDDVSAAFTWDPLALRTIDELISAVESPGIQRQVFRDLVNEADLVHFFGRVLSTRKHEVSAETDYWYSVKFQDSVTQRLAKLGHGNDQLINGRLQRDWLYVGERLGAVARSSPITTDSAISLVHHQNRERPDRMWSKRDPLDFWASYANGFGFEPREALEKDTELRRNVFGGDIGCHWVRCPFYGGDMAEFGINVFRCTGCQKAFYCSIACQRLHWKQGPHRSTCRT